MRFYTTRFLSLTVKDLKLGSYAYIRVTSMIVYIARFTMPIFLKGGLKQSILHLSYVWGDAIQTQSIRLGYHQLPTRETARTWPSAYRVFVSDLEWQQRKHSV
jgi:hypothetical protein